MDGSTAGQADLLDIFLFTNAKFQHLRLAIVKHFHCSMDDCRLDTTTAYGACQLTALTDYQFRAGSTRSRTSHRNHCSYGNPFTTSAPALNIRKYITHRDTPLKLT